MLTLFLSSLVLEKVVRSANLRVSGTIIHKSDPILTYADVINVMWCRKADIDEAFTALKNVAAAVGLQVNIPKTNYMTMSSKPGNISTVKLAG